MLRVSHIMAASLVLLPALGCALSLSPAQRSQAAQATAPLPAILVMGDSLSASYGIRREEGWVALLEEHLIKKGVKAVVVNASVSGETTAGGKARLSTLLSKHKPTHVVIELGANDALRGQPLGQTQENLTDMVRTAKKSGARVLILGMRIPPNYGGAYAARFEGVFAKTAQDTGAALVPFMLAGVADATDQATLFLPDGLHPNAKAQSRILDTVWPELSKMLR